tara:strand:+ start:1249 stop:1440 length:192 start_codon:yes stop_codon:yes gene_type:complete
MKPGYKTTEFWMALGAATIGAATASGVIPSDGALAQAIGLIATALVALGYTGARFALKKQPQK